MKATFRPFVLAALLLAGFSAGAQDTASDGLTRVPLFSGANGFRRFSIGVNGGILAPVVGTGGSNDFTRWQATFGYGGYLKYQIAHHFALQADFLKGTLQADNTKATGSGAPVVSPYSSYKTDLNYSYALSGIATFGNINWLSRKIIVIPYIGVGGGIANYSPHLVSSAGVSADYKPGGSINELFIPVQMGLKFGISSGVNLEVGYSMNYLDGDNLDGYKLAPSKDKFSYGHIGVEFAIGNKTHRQLQMHNAPAQLYDEQQAQNDALRARIAADEANTAAQLARLSQLDSLRNELARMKMDSDGDGVPDAFDKCPGTPAGTKVDGSGCPLPVDTVKTVATTTYVITDEDRRIIKEAIANLEFDFNKASIRPHSYPSLNRVAEILVKKGFSLKLAGHTDSKGSDDYNMRLSKDRAESVKNYLVSQGANPSRIEATGYGETQPIASNKTEAGRQKNRRVEFTLY